MLPVSPELTETIRILLMSDDDLLALKSAHRAARRGKGAHGFLDWLAQCSINGRQIAAVYRELAALMLSRQVRGIFWEDRRAGPVMIVSAEHHLQGIPAIKVLLGAVQQRLAGATYHSIYRLRLLKRRTSPSFDIRPAVLLSTFLLGARLVY